LIDKTAAISKSTIAKTIAEEIFISPKAKGLYFFCGCCLSDSASIISLKIYTTLDIKQKRINPIKTIVKVLELNNCLEKTSGTKTKKFLIH